MLVRAGRRASQAPLDRRRQLFSSITDNHRLRTRLKLHLATDDSAVANVPFAVNGLAEESSPLQGHVQMGHSNQHFGICHGCRSQMGWFVDHVEDGDAF